MIAELASSFERVDSIKPGDEIALPQGAWRTVSAVKVYDDAHVVVYFADDEVSFENKARDKSGANYKRHLVERSIIPLRADDTWEVRRGNQREAERLRALLRKGEAERIARAEARQQWL